MVRDKNADHKNSKRQEKTNKTKLYSRKQKKGVHIYIALQIKSIE